MSEPAREDAAWVRIPTGLARMDLIEFCRDAERLLRINSLYEFQEWRPAGQDRFFWRARNLANGCAIETALRVVTRPEGVRLIYESGLKTSTDFHVEAAGAGDQSASSPRSVLIVTDDYSGTAEDERRARGAEVDTSLTGWGRDLQRYLMHWRRWSALGPWRWYMRRIWQPMKPSARRVTFLLIVIAAIEIMLTILAALGFYFFRMQ